MAAGKKQAKKEYQKLELSIKKALGGFATGIKNKKLEKKIKKYGSDLAALILKLKEPTGVKVKKAKEKITPVKKADKSIPVKKK